MSPSDTDLVLLSLPLQTIYNPNSKLGFLHLQLSWRIVVFWVFGTILYRMEKHTERGGGLKKTSLMVRALKLWI